MKKTRNAFAAVATIALLGGMAHRAQGQAYVASTYLSQGSDASWSANYGSTATPTGSPVFETGATPTGGSGGTSNDNDSWGGNAHGVNGFGALGEAFVVSQTGVLSTAQVVFDGGTMSFNVELYDLGPAPANYPSGNPIGSGAGGAPSITQLNNLGVAYPTGGGANLLASTAFTYTAVAGTDLITIPFAGTPVTLQTGELYLLSLDPQANADSTWWVRGGVPVAGYNTGEGFNADGVAGMQNFEGKSTIRDMDMAITEVVPEPSTIALGVLGASSFLLRRRSK